jgi:GWxTD domain-containing protein
MKFIWLLPAFRPRINNFGKRWASRLFSSFLNHSFSFLLIGALLVTACNTLRPFTNKATTQFVLYNPGKTILHPQYKVFHSTETETIVFFKLLTSEIVFNQANPQVKSQAKLRVAYTLYSSLANNEIAIRDTQQIVIERESIGDQLVASIKLPTTPGKTYLLDITLEDQIRQSAVRDRVLVDRFQADNQQDWLVLNYPENKVAFEQFFYPGESFRLINRNSQSERVYISVFPPRNILPLPPYSLDEQPDNLPLPDSTFYMAYSEQLLYKLGGPGIYVFHFKSEPAKGLCLTQFGDHYPVVKEPEDMLPPLQFITTHEEYQKLISGSDLKAVVDQFWLDKGKSFGNARDLIRVYYNRVVFANLYFSSSKQGWKTDRGMIYLLLGPPSSVERTETREKWYFVASETGEKITFEFNLIDDYWIGYDFKLKRKEEFRPVWNRAVDSWRRGKIFSM